MNRSRRRKVLVGGVIGVALLFGGVAAALWTASGTGSGRAASLTAQAIVVTATTGAADLYPGFTDGDLHFLADNPNPYPVTFTSFTEGGVTSSDGVACPAANVTVDDSGAISLVVPANSVDAPLAIADVVTMSSGAPNGCQSKTFDVTLTLTGSQS